MTESEDLIKKLNLMSHPEGGHFSESFRDENNNVSLIYYLLQRNEWSHWHRLTKNETLHFYKGDPLLVHVSQDGKRSYTNILGDNIDNKENMHVIINAGSWFSMVSSGEYSLIGCTVAPGFNYSDFELAPKNWEPG